MTRKIILPTEAEDEEITRAAEADPDSPPLSDAQIAAMNPVRGPQKAATKTLVSIRLDADLVDTLRSSGKGWQSRVNDMLRKAVEVDK